MLSILLELVKYTVEYTVHQQIMINIEIIKFQKCEYVGSLIVKIVRVVGL